MILRTNTARTSSLWSATLWRSTSGLMSRKLIVPISQHEENETVTTAYRAGEYCFQPEEFFPKRLFEAITDARVNQPELILAEARNRRKRPRLTLDGKLVILATDHPGRR